MSTPAPEPSKHLATRPFKLTGKADMAAFWDAQGNRSAREVGKITGIHQTTISRWRSHDEYQARVVFWREKIIGEIEPLILSALSEYGKLVNDAAKEIARKLIATDEHSGRPDEATRTAAIKLLYDSPMVKRLFAVPKQLGDGDDTTPVQPVTLHVHLTQDGEVQPANTIEVGEFTEIEDG